MANEFDISFGPDSQSLVDFGEEKRFFARFGQVYTPGDGTKNYNELYNRPKIEGNTLEGDKTFIQLGLNEITPQEIDDMFDEMIFGGN